MKYYCDRINAQEQDFERKKKSVNGTNEFLT